MRKICVLLLSIWFAGQSAYCCTIGVVSSKASSTGRPFLWKNRDYSISPREEIKYREGKITDDIEKRIGSLRVVGETLLYSNIPLISGGVNDYGFAVVNDSVLENPEREILNINHLFVQSALESCRDVKEFENFVKNFDTSALFTISGNFAVIDAKGNAALYELWTDGPGNPVDFKKYDANKSEEGFVIRANSHQTDGWVDNGEECEIRYERAYGLFNELSSSNNLSPRMVMQVVSKDVAGDCDKFNPGPECRKYGYKSADLENFDTSLALSRNISTSAYVINGAKDKNDIPLITLYCASGEPSFTPAVPYFLFPKKISYYARAETYDFWGYAVDLSIGSFLGNASEKVLLDGLYANSRKLKGYDKTINYNKLLEVQEWVFLIEDFVFDKTEAFLERLKDHPEYITADNLYNFSHECAKYTYRNYRKKTSDAYTWEDVELTVDDKNMDGIGGGVDVTESGAHEDDETVSRGCFVSSIFYVK